MSHVSYYYIRKIYTDVDISFIVMRVFVDESEEEASRWLSSYEEAEEYISDKYEGKY